MKNTHTHTHALCPSPAVHVWCVCVCVYNSMEFCVWGMGFRNPPDVDCQLWDQFSICASGKNKQEKEQENRLERIGGLYG